MISLQPGQPFPPFTLPTLGGKLVSLADFAGKRIVLACWASFDPSREDLPAWQELARRPHKNPSEIVGVAIDVTGATLPMRIMREKRATFTCLVDAMQLLPRLAGFADLPATFGIDETGRLRLTGGRPDAPFLRDVEIFLNGRADPFQIPGVATEGDPRRGHDTTLDRLLQQATNFMYKNRPADAIEAMRRAVQAAPDNKIVRRQLEALEHPEKFYPGNG